MHVTFTYDPRREVDTLRWGFGSQNSPVPTRFAEEAQAAGVDFSSEEAVAAFAVAKIEREGIDTAALARDLAGTWASVELEAEARLKRIFQTDWDPGEVTAYLTLSTRCPYNIRQRYYYFVSIGLEKMAPIQVSLHELLHFYTHQLIEPLFVKARVRERHNDFKEALTALLDLEFADLLDRPDRGYPQHQPLREVISTKWKAGKNVYAIAQDYIQDNQG
ncbi:MAG: hypothetical protein AB7T06_37070 [Kofleriaceae bacterium]